jgi:hypothetical protein
VNGESAKAEAGAAVGAGVTSAETSDYVSALVASLLGWTLDAFDLFLVVVALPAMAHDFGRDIPSVALTITVTPS